MKEKRILLFAGTTEGRKLAEYLSKKEVRVHVCVATEYGESLILEEENITVSHERMNEEQMEEFMKEYDPDLVIDATHPYASEVTANIKKSCNHLKTEYIRLVRENTDTPDCIFVENIEDAVSFLKTVQGNILATTGSKELSAYTKIDQYKTRVFARVLSTADVVKKCEELGFAGRNLICMQGPFSVEMNVAMMKEFHIAYLVTKESGKAGGFPEKCEAAKRSGAKLVVIGRPTVEEGYSLEEMYRILSDRLDMKTDKRVISLVGIGTGAEDLRTLEAKKACEDAQLIIGARRMVEAIALPGQDSFISYKTEEIVSFIKTRTEYKKVAVVFSGDVGFYSGAKKLLSSLQKEVKIEKSMELNVIPGISSVVYFCAKLGISWEDVKLLSMHGKKENMISAIRDNRKIIALSGNEEGIRKLGSDMIMYGYGNLKVSFGIDLSYPTERIINGTASQLCGYYGSGLSVLYIENPAGGKKKVTGGLKDEEFIRGKTPMTKEEVRSVSLSKLNIQRDSIIYDIGAGTGSVSVEAAMLANQGYVYAIEVKEEAVELIKKNKYKFGTDNLAVLCASAPEALNDLPMPDCVFVGGSKGNLKEILFKITEKNPKVRVVINAISLETLSEAVSCVKALKEKKELFIEEEEIVHLSVAKSKSVGNYHMMMGQNPIFVISFTSRADFSKEQIR